MEPYFDVGGVRLYHADARAALGAMAPASVHCVVTSIPYYGLRDYGTAPQVWDGDPACAHEWGERRYYVEGGGGQRSADAFHAPGEANAARLKATRWKEDAVCARCGAWRGELGQEPRPALFLRHLVEIFRGVRRVLRPDGVLWLNVGDSYNAYNGNRGDSTGLQKNRHEAMPRLPTGAGLTDPGRKPKDLLGIPWSVAFALRDDGWYLRSDVVWSKPNPMPESVLDRPTRSHEFIFLLTPSGEYFYDADAVREPYAAASLGRYAYAMQGVVPGDRQPGGDLGRRERERGVRDPNPAGRNLRSVWTIATQQRQGEEHYASFPDELVRRCVAAGTSERGCCPACGAPYARDRAASGGWRPTCGCPPAAPVPCVVLDPFGGRGTTADVARRMGRHAVLIELQPDYCALIERNVAQQPTLGLGAA